MTINPAKRTFSEVETRYRQLRGLVYTITQRAFPASPVTFRETTYNDAVRADQWQNQWEAKHKRPIWSWVDMVNRYHQYNLLKRFDIALVSSGELVALCYGLPSKNKVILKIHTIARKPNENPLSGNVLNMLFYAATAYASLLGSHEIWLVEPMNITLIEKYQQMGYTPQRNKAGKVTHLSIMVNYEK